MAGGRLGKCQLSGIERPRYKGGGGDCGKGEEGRFCAGVLPPRITISRSNCALNPYSSSVRGVGPRTLKRQGWKSPSEVPSSEHLSRVYTGVNGGWEQGRGFLSDLTMGPGTCSSSCTQQCQILAWFVLVTQLVPTCRQVPQQLSVWCRVAPPASAPASAPSPGPHGTALKPAAPPVQPVQLCLQEQEGPAAAHADPHQ